MSDDDELVPKLGKSRSGPPATRPFARQIAASLSRSGGRGSKGGAKRFTGARTGRGTAAGRVLSARRGHSRIRRAIVKTRLIRLDRQGKGAARAHLRYLEREGTARDGSPGKLYDAGSDAADGRTFLEHGQGDRHQFRLILSIEDADQYDDLKPVVRRFMEDMQRDLGTRLEWVAIDHCDTAHPHSHVMIRGRDDQGRNLVIARDYIRHGMRQRLQDRVTLDLGPRSDREIERRLRHDIGVERMTPIDRQLLARQDGRGEFALTDPDPVRHALQAGRLKRLEAMGLATSLGEGRWKLVRDLEKTLRQMGEAGDIIRTMQREMTRARSSRPPADRMVHRQLEPGRTITGSLVAQGLHGEHHDRRFLLVDGIDGRVHHVDLGPGEDPLLPVGSILSVSGTPTDVKPADRTIAGIAEANGGHYSTELHQQAEPGASADYLEAHIRRLEALRRAGFAAERLENGQKWRVDPRLVEAIEAGAGEPHFRAPNIEILAPVPLHQLETANAKTWLDAEIERGAGAELRDQGFGRELRQSLAARSRWLIDEGLAQESEGSVRLNRQQLQARTAAQLAATASSLEQELSRSYVPFEEGARLRGQLTRPVDLAGGRMALLIGKSEFSLVPWQAGFERRIGRELNIRATGNGLSWSIGRGRSGPEIS